MAGAIVAAACGPLQLAPAAAGTAEPIIEQDLSSAPPLRQAPRRVALIVPLSGPQRSLGEAVRDGFIAGQLATADSRDQPEILIFDELDAGQDPFQAALAAQADAIVGPLLKDSIPRAAAATAGIAVLALNTVEPGIPVPSSMQQYALSPEDEARSAAGRAAAENRLRAVALAPDSDWGKRVLGAFAAEMERLGGSVVAFSYYNPAATDHTALLERLLLVDESRGRHRALMKRLGTPLEFEPRRRADADLVFLAGTPAAGRLMRPQLKFVYAGDLPVYATSAIHQPGTKGDTDMDGISFPDAPAVLGSDSRSALFRRTIELQWPSGGSSRLRFYAMGHDAWDLLTQTLNGTSGPLDGLTGVLTTDARGIVHRELMWGVFRNGGIVTLPDLIPPEPPTPDVSTP